MKYLTIFTAILFLVTPAMANQPYNIWKTQAGKSGTYLLVEVLDCANDSSKFCAEIREVINGEVWDVENDKIYAAKVTVGESQLRIEGCVSIFYDGQNWSRAD